MKVKVMRLYSSFYKHSLICIIEKVNVLTIESVLICLSCKQEYFDTAARFAVSDILFPTLEETFTMTI